MCFETFSKQHGIRYFTTMKAMLDAAYRDRTIIRVSFMGAKGPITYIRESDGTWRKIGDATPPPKQRRLDAQGEKTRPWLPWISCN